MEKKRNLWVIPTDKPSRLFKDNLGYYFSFENLQRSNFTNQNIYITSGEEIKEGDWVIFNELEIVKCTYSKNGEFLFSEPLTSSSNHHFSYFKKIILTTDQDLIKDGVQSIDDEFLEWFVKNPNCEEVEVNKIEDELISPKNPKIRFNALQDPPSFISAESLNNMILTYKYKIIIPKEELSKDEIDRFFVDIVCNPKEDPCDNCNNEICCCIRKQETLEEAAEKYANKKGDIPTTKLEDAIFKQGFTDGAKWQQERMYSEEEVVNILIKAYEDIGKRKIPNQVVLASWFKQFKKK